MIQSACNPFQVTDLDRTLPRNRACSKRLTSSVASTPLRAVFALVIAAVGLSQANASETASVVANVSTSTVRVAEPFSLELAVTVPVGTKVAFPATGKQLAEFDVVDSQDFFDIPVADRLDRRTWTRRMTLESIVTGDLSIPEIEIQVSDQLDSQSIHTKPIKVQVVSVLEDRGDPTKFRDIQSVVDVALPTTHSNAWAWWTMSGVLGLSLLGAVGMAVSRRDKWVTAKQWAMQELEGLETSIDAQTIDSESAALQLSKVVRDYLLLQFSIPQSGHTSQELVRMIEESGQVDPEITNQLVHLFALADKAKFAGLQLTEAGLKSAINDSRKLVERIADGLERNAQTNDATENR